LSHVIILVVYSTNKMKKDLEYSQANFGHTLSTLARLMRNNLNHRLLDSGYDISMEHMIILKILYRSDGISQNEFAKLFSKDKGSITHIINNMEKRNLVVRIPGQIDKRIKLIYLTPYAKQIKSEIHKIVTDFNDYIVESIPPDELKCCIAVLNDIINNLKQDIVEHTTK